MVGFCFVFCFYPGYERPLRSRDLLLHILHVFVVFSLFYWRSQNLNLGVFVHQSGTSGILCYGLYFSNV